MTVHKVDILSLNYYDGRQLPVLLNGIFFGLNRLGVDRAVALDKCKLACFVLDGDVHLFHSCGLLRPLRRGFYLLQTIALWLEHREERPPDTTKVDRNSALIRE